MRERKVSVSVLNADFLCLKKDLARVATADLVHIDVMDGQYVPNISFGPAIAKTIGAGTNTPLDIHLMVKEPEKHIPTFAALKPRWLTVHYEACTHLHSTISEVKRFGIGVGVALNPHTPLDGLRYILPNIDLVLVMTVNPGFGGQTFIPQMLDKIRDARKMIAGHPIDLQVDGGIHAGNVEAIAAAGANVIVAGSSIIGSNDPADYIRKLQGNEKS